MPRLGSYEWARQTGGSLTGAERRRLIGVIARSYHRLLIDRAKLVLGRVPAEAKLIDPDSIVPPDSKFAREAEQECAEQPESVIGHSYRTWIFGTALSQLDRSGLDPELFYVASLLHDAGIVEPTPGRDFTIKSAEVALGVAKRSGVEEARATEIADGICGHFTPGARIEVDGPVAFYVQNGALADLLGIRRPDLAPAVRKRAESEHPKGDAGREIGAMVRAESKAVPEGRVALTQRWAVFSAAARFGPSAG